MFALGIVDKIKPRTSPAGMVIAGTGTIDDEGNVGPIGGIPQKMVAAQGGDGAKVFLTPAANCAEAVRQRPARACRLSRSSHASTRRSPRCGAFAGRRSTTPVTACVVDVTTLDAGFPYANGAEPTVVMRNPLTRVSRRGRVTSSCWRSSSCCSPSRPGGRGVDRLPVVRRGQVHRGLHRVLTTRLVLFAVFGVGDGARRRGNLYLAYRLRPLLRPHSAEQHTLDRYRLLLLPHMTVLDRAVAGLIGPVRRARPRRGTGRSGCCSATARRSGRPTRSSTST